ncbi:hypothetical protein FVE85_3536 [Porphyridium purpureum]|uniref:BRCT domain-containing protein n=1 Tax=Porphyridium purpureum TaxID=35688 RepID=A0A5J4YLH3_PORPP|nr:hypothetical protein FVE85_3536 [Porphyridium purpureum]|eukprot:POR1851..scf249_10
MELPYDSDASEEMLATPVFATTQDVIKGAEAGRQVEHEVVDAGAARARMPTMPNMPAPKTAELGNGGAEGVSAPHTRDEAGSDPSWVAEQDEPHHKVKSQDIAEHKYKAPRKRDPEHGNAAKAIKPSAAAAKKARLSQSSDEVGTTKTAATVHTSTPTKAKPAKPLDSKKAAAASGKDKAVPSPQGKGKVAKPKAATSALKPKAVPASKGVKPGATKTNASTPTKEKTATAAKAKRAMAKKSKAALETNENDGESDGAAEQHTDQESECETEATDNGSAAGATASATARVPQSAMRKNRKPVSYSAGEGALYDALRHACDTLGEYDVLPSTADENFDPYWFPEVHVLPENHRRTLTLLKALAAGAVIVHEAWVFESISAEKWLKPEDYVVKKYDAPLKRQRQAPQLLDGVKLGVRGHVKVSELELRILVEKAGGSLALRAADASPCNLWLVGEKSAGRVQHVSDKSKLVSASWLWDSIETWQQLPLDTYRVA